MSASVFVLDACALIAFLTGEEGAGVVKGILTKAAVKDTTIYLHKINLLEVYYDAVKAQGKASADKIFEGLHKLPIQLSNDLSDSLLKKAGELKAINKISLADAIAVSLSLQLNAKLISSDHHEFDLLEQAGVARFKWIR